MKLKIVIAKKDLENNVIVEGDNSNDTPIFIDLIELLILLLFIIIEGYVIKITWNWLLPKLFNIQPISTLQAIVLSLFIGYFLYQENENKSLKAFCKYELLKYITFIIFCFILKQFI